ncbi:hypothetical protein [Streptomyces sp. NPDC048720]
MDDGGAPVGGRGPKLVQHRHRQVLDADAGLPVGAEEQGVATVMWSL